MAILPVRGKFSEGIIIEIDNEDLERCLQHTWWITNNKDKRPYTVIKKKVIQLHRFITQNKDYSIAIDHKDRNIYNNKKENLRIATHAQNKWNSKKKSTSCNKYKGVYPVYGNKWIADIMVNGIRQTIGQYKSEEIAAKARDKKAIELHGAFAYLNFPDFDYSNWTPPEDDRFKKKGKQKGVSYNTNMDCWVVRVQINNKRVSIGNYKNEQEAIEAYNKAKQDGIDSVPKRRRRDVYTNPPGVSFNERAKKWRAKIRIDQKEYHLGTFDTVEEAITARKDAEINGIKSKV